MNEDDIARHKIPSRLDLPTSYHPCRDLLMVIPLESIKQVGQIILPDRAHITLNEGHIVEKGRQCTDAYNLGDCVTWDAQSEYRLDVDGVKFILVRENCITMYIPVDQLLEENRVQACSEGEPGNIENQDPHGSN